MELVLKGIVLFVTFIYTFLLIGSIDSIADKGLLCLIIFIGLDIMAMFACKILISPKELIKITGIKYWGKYFKELD